MEAIKADNAVRDSSSEQKQGPRPHENNSCDRSTVEGNLEISEALKGQYQEESVTGGNPDAELSISGVKRIEQ